MGYDLTGNFLFRQLRLRLFLLLLCLLQIVNHPFLYSAYLHNVVSDLSYHLLFVVIYLQFTRWLRCILGNTIPPILVLRISQFHLTLIDFCSIIYQLGQLAHRRGALIAGTFSPLLHITHTIKVLTACRHRVSLARFSPSQMA